MKTKQKIAISLLVLGIILGALPAAIRAAAPAALVLSVASGDVVNAHVTGDPNSSIQLYFYPPGYTLPKSMPFGSTDGNGSYSSTFSSGAYGIPAGVKSYVIINGQQSASTAWPAYASNITLSQPSAQLTAGQSLTINSSSAPTASYNSNEPALTATTSGNSITLTAKAAGSGTLTVCATTVGCAGVTFTAGAQTQAAMTFSQNNISLSSGQSLIITINYASHGNGFVISANTNPDAVTASISGESNYVNLYGNNAGNSTITVCSKADSSACASLYVATATGAAAAAAVSFSQSTVILNYGQAAAISASGDPNNNYFVSSNSNPTIVSVGISGSNISLIGNNTAGAATVNICSLKSTAVCGLVYVTVATTSSTAPVSFTRNDIVLNNGQNVNVTVYGGIGSNYFIYSNSNSDVADVTISNNTLSITGKPAIGATTISVCSATVGSSCSNLIITTTATPVVITNPITLSQSNISFNPAQTATITVAGGSAGKNYTIASNSNSAVASGSVSGNIVTLNAGDSDGSAIINVCDSAVSAVCASIYVTVKAYVAPLSFSQNNVTLIVGNSMNIIGYYSGAGNSGLAVTYNSNPDVVTANLAGSSAISLVGGPATGSVTIAVCSATVNSDCAHLYVTTIAPPIVPDNSATAGSSTATPAQTAVKPAASAAAKVLGASTFKFTKLLKLGSIGKEVSELQKILKKLGYYTYQSITDLFGPITKKAVIAFQKAKGLKPYPGWVGPETRNALNKISQQ